MLARTVGILSKHQEEVDYLHSFVSSAVLGTEGKLIKVKHDLHIQQVAGTEG